MGGLYYPNQNPITLIGSKDASNSRTGVALQTTYQTDESSEAVKTVAISGYSKASLAVSYTMGAAETGNSIKIKVEQSPDGTNFYQLVNDSSSGDTSTLTKREFSHTGVDGGTSDFDIFLDVAYRYIRVSCHESGVASNAGNVYVELTPSGR